MRGSRSRRLLEPGFMVTAPRVYRLEGAYAPPPVPPGYAETQTPAGLSLVETIETSKGPWSGGSPYGRLIEFVYPAQLDAPPQLVFGIDRQPGPPRARTLHLFRSDAQIVPQAMPVLNAGVYAKVTYGIGGVQNIAYFDWNRGGQVSLTCDALVVEAEQYAPTALDYEPPAGVEVLGCMLSHEGSAPPRPPTFTTQEVTLLNTETADFAVPDFARWCFVCNASSAQNTGDVVSCFNFGNVPLKRLVITPQLMALGFPIPGGTTQIEVRNNGAATQAYLLQFELGL